MAFENNSRNENFTQRAAWIAGANFLSFALSTATPFILVHLLTQSQMGLYKQSIQIVMTMTGMFNLQMAASAYYFVPQKPEKRFQIAFNIILFYFLIGSLIAATFVLFPEWSSLISKSSEIAQHVPLIGLVILVWLVGMNLEVLPLALGDARISAVFIVLIQISRSVLTIGAALLFRNERAILWSVLIQCLCQLAFGVWYLWHYYQPWRAPWDWKLFKTQLAYAIPYGTGSIIFIFQSDLHNYIVSRSFSPDIYAIYAIGCFQLPLIGMLTGAFMSIMIPEFAQLASQGKNEAIIEIWMGAIRKCALLIIPLCTGLFVVRADFYAFLFPKEYASAASIFAIYLLSLLLTIAMPGPIIRAFSDLRFYQFKLYLALTAISLGVLSLGVKLGGLLGVIFGVVCIQAIDTVVSVRVAARRVGCTSRDWRRLRPILRVMLAASIAALATYGLKPILPYITPTQLAAIPRFRAAAALTICGLAFVTVYTITAFLLHAITEDELKELHPMALKLRRFIPSTVWHWASQQRHLRLRQREESGLLDYSIE